MSRDTKPLLNGVSSGDRAVLRKLGESLASALEVADSARTADLWRRMNDLDPVRPVVRIDEIPWHELAQSCDALTLQCVDPFLREIEGSLRQSLYQWRHFPVDMVLDDHIECPKVWTSTGIGITVDEETLEQHDKGGIVSHHFTPQITGPDDIDKIEMPVVQYDEEATHQRHAMLAEIFDGVLPVKVRGVRRIWFTPWDNLIALVDMTGFMMDMLDRPEFIDALVARYVDVKLHELDQIEALGLLDSSNDNCRVGSGGYSYTRQLPSANFNTAHATCRDLWGCSNAQIFSEISPEMHWEFALKHELRWLKRWGLSYYGCCEPLHNKIEILKRIPNLRKISISPWCDIPKARENGAEAYALSVKVNPAIFAEDTWQPERAREEIRARLSQSEGCAVELVLKDISTIRDDPKRLEDWARIAMEEVGADSAVSGAAAVQNALPHQIENQT